MNVVQTCWSCHKKDLLQESFGWLSPEYHLMSWALSCLQLNKYYPQLTLYADSAVTEMFIDRLKLPYTEVFCTLDGWDRYDPRLWALPKISTYSSQEVPFIHIDGDVYIWKPLSEAILAGELIAQNREAAPYFYQPLLEDIVSHLPYIPIEILREINSGDPIGSYNAGILGGSDIHFFREYGQRAFEMVDRNIDHLQTINIAGFNTIFEQYLFYCLAKGRQVHTIIPKVIGDLRYPGFADFPDIPHHKQYLHLHGLFKKNPSVCRQLARRLRNDHPEYYYRIISLFRKGDLPLFRDEYFFTAEKEESSLLQRYYFLKNTETEAPFAGTGSIPAIEPASLFSFPRTAICQVFFEKASREIYLPELIAQMDTDIRQLEEEIGSILTEDFTKIDKTLLYQIDILSTGYLEQLFGNKELIHSCRIVRSDHYTVIPSRFDWTILDEGMLSMDRKFSRIIASGQGNNYAIIVPECCPEGYTYYHSDDLDILILEALATPLSVETLVRKVGEAFDAGEAADAKEELELLVYGRIKRGMVRKTIRAVTWNPKAPIG